MKARLTDRPNGERGFTIIEVMVTASVVLAVSLGVLAALDSGSLRTGANKSRTIAANLAEADVERMHAMEVPDLSNLAETSTRTVEGVRYTIDSRAQWVSDQSGRLDCKTGSARADYLSVRSRVTWPKMNGVDPVEAHTIITPRNGSFGPGQGSLAVEIMDRNGHGVQGISVHARGPQTYTGTTDENGCVLWGYIPIGVYDVTFSSAGKVDPDGNGSPSKPVDVTSGRLSTQPFQYDTAGSIDVAVDTEIAGTVRSATAEYVSVGHSGLAPPSFRPFGNGTSRSTYTLGSLFPFTSRYTVYSGNCTGANPMNYGVTTQNVQVDPGSSQAMTVREPALMVTVTMGGAPVNNARVYMTPAPSSGCAGTVGPVTTQPDGTLPANGDRGLPFGLYTVCAQHPTLPRRFTATDVPNTSPAGSNLTIDLPTTTGTGPSCP